MEAAGEGSEMSSVCHLSLRDVHTVPNGPYRTTCVGTCTEPYDFEGCLLVSLFLDVGG